MSNIFRNKISINSLLSFTIVLFILRLYCSTIKLLMVEIFYQYVIFICRSILLIFCLIFFHLKLFMMQCFRNIPYFINKIYIIFTYKCNKKFKYIESMSSCVSLYKIRIFLLKTSIKIILNFCKTYLFQIKNYRFHFHFDMDCVN